MAIIQFPGTDFHDLNLDWVLQQVKNLLTEWASTKEEWETLKGSNEAFVSFITSQWDDFKSYVENYLANLPLTEEVSAKINAMVEDGTLLELITHDDGEGSALSDVVAQWLAAHITQETGYVIDDTLTVQGAAADAKATGDAIADLKGAFVAMASNNLLNPAHITAGKFYKTETINGRVMIIQSDNSAYSCGYVDIVSGQDYSLTGISYTAYNGDADGYAIGQAYATNTSVADPTLDTDAVQQNYGNTDKTINRLYFSWRPATYPTESFMVNAGSTLLAYVPYHEPYQVLADDVKVKEKNIIPETYMVDINGGGDYTSFSACLVALADNSNEKIIYIKPGVYDVFEEIGGATFAAEVEAARQEDPDYTWLDCSTVVPPHTKIIGIGEVVLKFKPQSTEITTQVMSLLSPVNVIYDVYMENITIDCDNCRYGIHDETGHIDGVTGTRHIYKNVKIIKAQTDGGMNSAFGCGMQKNQYMEFDCCDFSSPNRPFSFHNKGTGDAMDNTIIILKNCVSRTSNESGNALRFGNVNGYQVKIDVRVFNCYLYGANVWIGNESSTERPNAYALTLVKSGNPTITIENETNIYTPVVYQ